MRSRAAIVRLVNMTASIVMSRSVWYPIHHDQGQEDSWVLADQRKYSLIGNRSSIDVVSSMAGSH